MEAAGEEAQQRAGWTVPLPEGYRASEYDDGATDPDAWSEGFVEGAMEVWTELKERL